jgi:hypothetical protein
MFNRERKVIEDATATVRDSSHLLMAVAGLAVVLAAVALVVAVSVKVSK